MVVVMLRLTATIIIAATLATRSASADEVARATWERPGPIVTLGMGSLQHGEIGVELSYAAWRWSVFPVTVAPWAAFGKGGYPWSEKPIASAGFKASVGWRHRIALDVGAGWLSSEALVLHGTQVANRSNPGLLASAGYEFIGTSGVVLRFMLGEVVNFDRYTGPAPETQERRAGFSFGWKLW